jgi:hypothetical protein
MITQNRGTSKIITALAIAVAAVVLIGIVAGFEAGLFNTDRQNSSPTQTPTSNPSTSTPEPTVAPTDSPALTSTPSPTAFAEPTPTPPPPSLHVTVAGSDYNDTMGQFTTFTCTVSVNNHAYDSLVSKLVAAQDITVTNALSNTPVTGDIAVTLNAVFPQLHMNYGISKDMTISSAINGQFTIILHSESVSSVPGGINTDTLAGALTDKLNQLLATQI